MMSKVIIKPELLEFHPPLVTESTIHISINNTSEQVVAFKVKTTAPKLYCVRPTAALVQPGESVKIEIVFLGLTEEPIRDTKCKDKFLVLALPAPYDLEGKSVADAWSGLETEFKQDMISKKIKVKYVYDSEISTAETTNVTTPVIPAVSVPEPATQGMRNGPTEVSPVNQKAKSAVLTSAPATISKPLPKEVPQVKPVSKGAEETKISPVAAYDVPLAKADEESITGSNSRTLILIAVITMLLALLYA